MTIEVTVVVFGKVVEWGVPENTVFIVHFDDRQCRVVLVGQPSIRIDVIEKYLLPLPFRVLQFSHHSDHARSALSGTPIRQFVVKVRLIAIVRRDYMRVE